MNFLSYKDFLKRFFRLEDEVGQLEKKVAILIKENEEAEAEIEKLKQKHSPQLIFTTIIFNTKIKILAMTLETKQFVDSILGLEDSDTKAIIFATFANVVLTSSDPTIFTADGDVNGDGTVDIVGVAPGTGTLTVAADATYTDSNTGQPVTANKTATVDVTVSAPAPTAENTDLVVSFTNPAPTP